MTPAADEPMPDDGAPASDEEAPLEQLPPVSLDILNLVKTSHAQHGLRHGDYSRYRQYCSRRLHRLRKSSGLTHGKGRFARRPLEPRLVRDGGQLMLALYSSERAWAYAMQLKRETSAAEPRPKYHAMHRLRKAARWSASLAQLCAVRSDKRTALEADAYCGFMHGNMHLEWEEWAPALQQLKRTRTICAELSKASIPEQVPLYKQMIEEVEPSIRFCAYNLRRAGGDTAEEDEANDVEGLASAEGASDLLRSKLELVLDESRAKQAKDLNEMEVLGERVPIKSEKTRICLIRAHQTLYEIEQAGGDASDAAMAQYDQLFVAFNDALEGVRADLRAIANDKAATAGVGRAHLQKLQTGLTWQKHHHTVRRTQLLVRGFQAAFASSGGGGGASKKVTPDDIVRLYDSIVVSLGEMSQLDGYKEDEALMGQVFARLSAAKAQRCFWVAESFGAMSKWKEAQVLYDRTMALMLEAVDLLKSSGYEAELPAMEALEKQLEGAKARAQAEAFLVRLQGEPTVAGSTSDLTQMSLAASRPATLLESLDTFDRPHVDRLIAFPPQFETVPCKPLLFDIARNAIVYPDVSSRAKAKRSWLGGSWFGSGR
mmetsp:Transcript_12941/g.27476  ORF Transcript_12941/g.27476 Transcript_12941/m.27476 type:complete len:601 (-) Transcript_12941:276-2078(-)